jgi:hypothetical protein
LLKLGILDADTDVDVDVKHTKEEVLVMTRDAINYVDDRDYNDTDSEDELDGYDADAVEQHMHRHGIPPLSSTLTNLSMSAVPEVRLEADDFKAQLPAILRLSALSNLDASADAASDSLPRTPLSARLKEGRSPKERMLALARAALEEDPADMDNPDNHMSPIASLRKETTWHESSAGGANWTATGQPKLNIV